MEPCFTLATRTEYSEEEEPPPTPPFPPGEEVEPTWTGTLLAEPLALSPWSSTVSRTELGAVPPPPSVRVPKGAEPPWLRVFTESI